MGEVYEMANAMAKNGRSLRPGSDRPARISGRSRKEIEQLYAAFRRDKNELILSTGETRSLPDSLDSFLIELIELLNDKKSVIISQDQATLTTLEAASLLGVSRQFFVNLLEKDEIPYHMVGTHRRVYARDLFQYKAQRDRRRHEMIRGLAQAEADEGLYDREPSAIDED